VQIVTTGAAAVQAQIDGYEQVLTSTGGTMSALGFAPAGPDAPGQPGGARYVIGNPTRPPLTFDEDFVFDPDADAGFGDYVSWNVWGTKADAARLLRPDLDDALNLYGHYRDASGDPVTVDYEEAYREDPSIRQGVDAEFAAARQGIEQLHRDTGKTSPPRSGSPASTCARTLRSPT
jgi:hypothetical protein